MARRLQLIAAVDPITSALQEMYEEFPYPPTSAPEQRVGWDVRLLLSLGERRAPTGRKLTALDAGCGRGVGTLGSAALQPDVEFVGVDVNRVALAEATAQAKARGLHNVRFQHVDLTTLEGLAVPPGGFDAVFSSGVIHHMPDPALGLRKLREVLAPHGMLKLMVYGRDGYRVARAIDLLVPRATPLRDRLTVGQHLVRNVPTDVIGVGIFADLRVIGDAEFVDRYLNVNETSFDVAGLWQLLSGAGLRFVRWTEPDDWSLDALLPKGPVRELAALLPLEKQYALIEQLTWKAMLDLTACNIENEPRQPLDEEHLRRAMLSVSPEVSFRTDVRNVAVGQRVEHLSVHIRGGRRIPIAGGPGATAVLLLRERTTPIRGEDLARALEAKNVPRATAMEVITDLVAAEVLYVA